MERPASVDSRRFVGDWEGDTVVGKLHGGCLATLVERKSRFTVLAKIDTGRAEDFNAAVWERVSRTPWLPFRTLTVDNGPEFTRHVELENKLNSVVYFAEPYCSWQRGTNENTNGLIRQYFPKGTDFKSTDAEKIALVENLLNNRPRKVLGYRTSLEVMAKACKKPIVPLRV